MQPTRKSFLQILDQVLVPRRHEHDHLHRLIQFQQAANQIPNEDADALRGRERDSIVAPNADPQGPYHAPSSRYAA
jgi:hypothetical protein